MVAFLCPHISFWFNSKSQGQEREKYLRPSSTTSTILRSPRCSPNKGWFSRWASISCHGTQHRGPVTRAMYTIEYMNHYEPQLFVSDPWPSETRTIGSWTISGVWWILPCESSTAWRASVTMMAVLWPQMHFERCIEGTPSPVERKSWDVKPIIYFSGNIDIKDYDISCNLI